MIMTIVAVVDGGGWRWLVVVPVVGGGGGFGDGVGDIGDITLKLNDPAFISDGVPGNFQIHFLLFLTHPIRTTSIASTI